MTVPRSAAKDRTDGRIDTHAHYLPPDFVAYVERAVSGGARALLGLHLEWSPETHIEYMDQWGIEATVVSLTTPGVLVTPDLPRPELRRLARSVNEYGAELIRQHGDRFGVHTVLPLPDVDGALEELTYGLDVLELDGVGMYSNYGGVYHGDPLLNPVYEELDRREALVYVHPAIPPHNPAPGLAYANAQLQLELPFDTTRTVTNLIYTGAAGRYPNIKWQFPHLGGAMLGVAYRLALAHVAHGDIWGHAAPEGPFVHMRRFRYDTSGAVGLTPLTAARTLLDPGHVMFGTDYPYHAAVYRPETLSENRDKASFIGDALPRPGEPAPLVNELFTQDERRAIVRDNALAVLPRLADRLAGSAG